jgi:hypothetical protein
MGACGSSAGAAGDGGKSIKPLTTRVLDDSVAGLEVKVEDVGATIRRFEDSYVDAISVYSLRDKGVLQATLQASRFADADRLKRASFRRGLVDQVGGVKAQVLRVGKTDAYVTRATGQRIFVWFEDRRVFVLSVRDGYRARYALLRAVLAEVEK